MAIGSKFEPKEGCPSFFKVIRYPSAPHLKLPNAFVRSYLKKIPKNPVLKTATGEHLWELKFIKSGEDYYFAHGWDELVKDAKLGIQDIVVFWLIDPNTFQVLFLDANGCDKDLPFKYEDDGDHNVDGHDDDDDDEEDLCFEKIISKKTHKYHMSLPKKFVEAAELENKTSVKLKNQEGKEWTVGILAERYERTRYSLSARWLKFRRYNQLSDGDNCVFKFNKKDGVLYLTRVLKSKIPVKQESLIDEVKENKGRPIFHGVKVKTEYESGSEVEAEKRKRGRLRTKQPDGGAAIVKIENESVPENDRWVMSKHVVYF